MSTLSGWITQTVTLDSTMANETLVSGGLINAYGPAGTYSVDINGTLTPETLSAALFAPKGFHATVTNFGTIESHGTNSGNWFDAGVVLGAHGTVINAGLIASAAGIFIDGGTASTGALVNNSGRVEGSVSVGIILTGAGSIVNSGTISGNFPGVTTQGSNASYLSNALGGLITSSHDYGVVLDGSGKLVNAGTIAGYGGGIKLDGTNAATVLNSGSLISQGTSANSSYGGYIAVNIKENVGTNIGAVISNSSNGVILGEVGLQITQNGITSSVSSPIVNTIFNAGLIEGTLGQGVVDWTGAAVLANSGSIISTQSIGVELGGSAGTLINSGLISGKGEAVSLAVPGSVLELLPGASFAGSIVANNATLVLGSAATAGTFDMGGTVTGFNHIVFDSGSTWTLEGNTTALSGSNNVISGFAGGDTLVLEGFTASSDTLTTIGGGTYALLLANGSSTIQLDLAGTYTPDEITFSAVGAGTEIHLCYLRGTRILTPAGERLVEDLRAGDEVVTRYAGRQKVKWIGRQNYAGRFIAANPDKIPVRILAGALGQGLPARDLSLSPGHAVLLGDTLVLAQNLVNGITVRQDEVPELVEYYAIELETHDCVIAEGLYAESFADGPGLRNQFHNLAEFHALFPGYAEPDEISLCAPRPERGSALEAVLRPVVARAAQGTRPGALRGFVDLIEEDGLVEGWAQDSANPELPVLLEIRCQGEVLGHVLACDMREDLALAGIGKGRAMFSLRLPGGLAGTARHDVSVHRAADGALLPLSDDCRARIGLPGTRAA